MIPIKIPVWARSGLGKSRVDTAAVEKMLQACDWIIEWAKYPNMCRFYVRDSHWGISTPGELTISGRTRCRGSSRNWRISLEAEMPKDAGAISSQVSVGIYRLGMIHHGELPLKKIGGERGGKISCVIPLRFDYGTPPFRMILKISGNVILKKLTLQELPDDLAKAEITVLEGTLKELSAIPDPQKSDYPDCRFTALMEGDSIIDGARCPKKIQFVIDGFKNYKLLATGKLKPDDKVRCSVIPFEKLPDEQKTVQQADDLNLFELQSYYVLEVEKIPGFSENSTIPFSGKQEHVSVFERKINPPLSDDAKTAQRRAVEESLARIDEMLEPYSDEAALKKLNRRFAKVWKEEKAKDPAGKNRCGDNLKFVWRNVDGSFWVLPENYVFATRYRALDQEKLDALTAFQDFLNANGCQLMIGIVPDLFAISARVINREFRDVPDFGSARLTQQLLKNNLEAVYISDSLLKGYNRYPFAFFWPVNAHPSDTTQDILADVFADRLRRYGFKKTLDGKLFTTDAFPHTYTKQKLYQFPENCDIGSNRAGATYLCRRVLYDGKEVLPDPRSPILVLGNSFIQTPMFYPDSFPTLLASKMHAGIASCRVDGVGPMTSGISQLFSHPERFLKGKSVLILILGVSHFYATEFTNIREIDRQMLWLAGKTPVATVPLCGNETNIPLYFRSLAQAKCFTIPAGGKQLVVDLPLPDEHRDATLVIPVCARAARERTQLIINDASLAIPGSYSVYRWNRIVVPMPKNAERLTIELVGKPGTTVALGDIQFFK
jgi:hypothetical protein